MEFSWLLIALGFALFFGCGRACGWGSFRAERRRGRGERSDRLSGGGSRRRHLRDRHAEMLGRGAEKANGREEGKKERARIRARGVRGESPLAELQRKFVEGRLTLDEYEREIDALERLD